jgi:hypothetical protein
MVHLTISRPVNQDRALTDDLARGGVDYYEVAFADPDGSGRIYRAAWDYTKTGRIAVPPGDYYGAAKAILFAGRYSDKTLLAVGLLTKIEGDAFTAIGDAVIEPNTTNVTFTLGPLTNSIQKDKGTSTFKITSPTTPYNYTTAGISGSDIPTGEIDNASYPVFRIPRNTPIPVVSDGSEITATYKVNIPSITTVPAVVLPPTPPITADTDVGIIIQGAGSLLSSGVFYNQDAGVKVEGTILEDSGAISTVPTAGFTISISTAGLEAGLSRLSIEVPVCAIATTGLDAPGTWYIRGGMSQNVLDAGGNSLGGAILLAVGPVKINGIDIHPEWP